MSTVTTATDPNGNGTWSLIIKTPPIHCLRGSLGTISSKNSIRGGNFVAQWPPPSQTTSIVRNDRLLIAVGDGDDAAENRIY